MLSVKDVFLGTEKKIEESLGISVRTCQFYIHTWVWATSWAASDCTLPSSSGKNRSAEKVTVSGEVIRKCSWKSLVKAHLREQVKHLEKQALGQGHIVSLLSLCLWARVDTGPATFSVNRHRDQFDPYWKRYISYMGKNHFLDVLHLPSLPLEKDKWFAWRMHQARMGWRYCCTPHGWVGCRGDNHLLLLTSALREEVGPSRCSLKPQALAQAVLLQQPLERGGEKVNGAQIKTVAAYTYSYLYSSQK